MLRAIRLHQVFASVSVLLATGASALGSEACPHDFSGGSAVLTCQCSPEAARVGDVWGTLTYTADSRICRAALHAGAITPHGGEVTVLPEHGRDTYAASLRNGVQTSSYGRYGASFRFQGIDTSGPEPCPPTLQYYQGVHPLACVCEPRAMRSGEVWGSFIYTADSQICRAALHAGAIGPAGGVVTIIPEPGRPGYRGSNRNGVISSAYDSYGASFRFEGVRSEMGRGLCPDRFTGFAGETAPLECLCPGDATVAGDVWGTDVYTSDSKICRAAVHAGVIDRFGGSIKVLPMPGQDSYRGSNRNGVRTGEYGSWRHSFRFEGERRVSTAPVQAPVVQSLERAGQVQLYINFQTGSAEIEVSAAPVLGELVEALKADPAMRLRLVGHTDNTGTPRGNRTLSQQRADAVRAWLIRQGIGANRLAVEGKGQDEPIADNTTEEGRALNRRVQAIVVR